MKAPKMHFPQPYMPPGSKGGAVVTLQLMLKAMGYNDNILPDGDYGNETAKAVKAFQKEMGIDDDGCFGPDTRTKFKEKTGIDVNTLPSQIFMRRTTVPAEN